MIAFAACKKIKVLRDSNWKWPTKFKTDTTRCGARKVSQDATCAPHTLPVVIRLTYADYLILKTWYEQTDMCGLYTFSFPCIEDMSGTLTEYAFAKDGGPQIKNPGGTMLDISMTWETV